VRQATGKSCTELLQQRRIEVARQMLSATNETVAAIGAAVGYNNLSYFHTLFKEQCGLSPREYRGSHRS
ncbi:MAG: helix-turn-helix transcriptional regulator, partial [Candidatus Aphodomonas sp.]|nr:helix-turn-helix transcriptional regulator [Candidatus Aphodomonas sp.]